MRARFFDSGTPVWRFIGNFGEMLILSLLWALCSFPLITAGAASTALYDTIVHCIRNREEDIFTRFWRTLKKELVPSIPSSLLWEIILAGAFLLLRTYALNAGTSRAAYASAIGLIFLLIFILGIACWVFPILSRFTSSFVSLNVTSVKLAVANTPRTIALGAITAVSVWLCVSFILPVMILPSVAFLSWSYLIEPVFQKYM